MVISHPTFPSKSCTPLQYLHTLILKFLSVVDAITFHSPRPSSGFTPTRNPLSTTIVSSSENLLLSWYVLASSNFLSLKLGTLDWEGEGRVVVTMHSGSYFSF